MSEKIDIGHLAKLSRLELKQEEKEKYAAQLGGVLEYAKKIGSFRSPESFDSTQDKLRREIKKPEKIESGIINGVKDVMREDEVGKSLPREEALKNAPAQKDGFIAVKAVFGSETDE